MEASINVINRRTGTYRHSLSFPANVLAPHTTTPLPANSLIGLIEMANSASLESDASCTFGASTAFNCTLAGARQTPRLRSTAAEYTGVVQAALAQCSTRKDRFTIFDAYEDGNFSAMDGLRNQLGNDLLQYGAAYYPHVATTLAYQSDDSSMVTHLQSGAVPSSAPAYSGSLGNLKSTAPPPLQLPCGGDRQGAC